MNKIDMAIMAESALNTVIDTVQSSKKIFINTFVKQEDIAATLNEFVDAQTTFSRKTVGAGIKVVSKAHDALTDNNVYVNVLETAQDAISTIFGNKTR